MMWILLHTPGDPYVLLLRFLLVLTNAPNFLYHTPWALLDPVACFIADSDWDDVD
jgi:hypothetical protein